MCALAVVRTSATTTPENKARKAQTLASKLWRFIEVARKKYIVPLGSVRSRAHLLVHVRPGRAK